MKHSKVCKVSGGNLPDGFEAKVDVTIDYEGISDETMLDWATSHVIINVQRVLRGKTTAELIRLSGQGYETKASVAGRSTADPKVAYKGKFLGMTEDERNAELAELAEIHKAKLEETK